MLIVVTDQVVGVGVLIEVGLKEGLDLYVLDGYRWWTIIIIHTEIAVVFDGRFMFDVQGEIHFKSSNFPQDFQRV